MNASIHSFQEAAAALGKKEARTIGNNTTLSRLSDSEIALELHGSAIVRFHDNGTVGLSSCGWPTVTTKDRISQCLPVGWQLMQEHKAWYLLPPLPADWPTMANEDEDWRARWDWQRAHKVPFVDGIVLCSDGVSSPGNGGPVTAMRSGWKGY